MDARDSRVYKPGRPECGMEHRSPIALAILFVVLLTVELVQAGEIRLAADTSVLSNGTWIRVSELKAGDTVQTLDGQTVKITTVEDVKAEEPASCYTAVLNDSNLVPVIEPGLAISGRVPERTCNWLCRFLGRLRSHAK